MRGATLYARRARQLLRNLRTKLGRVNRPTSGDAITQMILGILTRDMPEPKAREALERLRSAVVDFNELRVIAPIELAELLGDYPDARLKCEDISRALNKVFALEHTLVTDRLAAMSAKEAAAYLDRIDGLEAYTRARVRLLGLGQHAIPLDEAMWAYARAVNIVDKHSTLEETQRFLERHIPEGDALDFVALVKRQAWTDFGSAVRRGEVERIRSIPPDRSSRNMLQPMAPLTAADAAADVDGEVIEPPSAAKPAAKAPRVARRSRSRVAAGQSAKRKPRPAAGPNSARARRPRATARPAAGRSTAAVRKSKPGARTKSG